MPHPIPRVKEAFSEWVAQAAACHQMHLSYTLPFSFAGGESSDSPERESVGKDLQ